MPLESIVLIIALFGSAKVALDVVVMVVRFLFSKSGGKSELERAVVMLEGLSTANEVLQRENHDLKVRLDHYEESQKKTV
ncbi:hypothetical protein [Diaphorobacter sp. J5-51]|uniref:hypothetical protein n=1 Tax=Diaphorobacter sp. J5-51 TaxID=680496 RepID=UPI0012F8D6FF|nr:hypothetical protein [Diaphorobacter sp. J5-51]